MSMSVKEKIEQFITEAAVLDKHEIKLGRRVEEEHKGTIESVIEKVKNEEEIKLKDVYEMIAKDHLREVPDYYTRLIKMEAEAGIKESAILEINDAYKVEPWVRTLDDIRNRLWAFDKNISKELEGVIRHIKDKFDLR